MKKILVYVMVALGALFWIFCVAQIPTKQIINVFRTEVSQAELESVSTASNKYLGREAADDVTRITSKMIEHGEVFSSFAVDTLDIIPLDQYQLKDDSSARSSRGRSTGSITRRDGTDSPLFYEKFLYGQYCLIELDDGSYMVGYMDSDYMKFNFKETTLPVGMLVLSDSSYARTWIEDLSLDGKIIHTNFVFMMHDDDEPMITAIPDFIIRIIFGLGFAYVLLIIAGTIATRLKV